MLKSIYFEGQRIEIKSRNTEDDNNYYTVFVGENGVGKTRIFENILEDFSSIEVSKKSSILKFKDENECSKVIFSTYTLFNRTEIKYNNKKKIYTTKYDSQNIIKQVSNMYVKSYWFNEENKLFRNTLEKLESILKLESNPKIIMNGITGIDYKQLINKVKKVNDPISLYKLVEKKSSLINKDIVEIMRENVRRYSQKNKLSQNYKMVDKYTNENIMKTFTNSSEAECFISILCLKIMLIENRQQHRFSSEIKNAYDIEELKKFYQVFLEVGVNQAEELIKIDYDICDILEIDFVNNLAYKTYEHGVKNYIFENDKVGNTLLINQFSSGEFAFYSRIMEIAVHHQENSLILIDEPETFLNPRWVFEFIDFLKTLFANQNTHFILASQSPFIIGSVQSSDLIKLKRKNDELIVRYDFDETLGATFDNILKDVFDIDIEDNKLVDRYFRKVKKKSEENIAESFSMMTNIANSPKKMELLEDLSTEDNIKKVLDEIKLIEREYFDE